MTAAVVEDERVPMLGEPLPLDLANTTYVVRGQLRDGLRSPAHLAAWLSSIRDRLATPLSDDDLAHVDDAQLRSAQDLRGCVHALARASLQETIPEPDVLDRLNRHATAGSRWNELRWDDEPRVQLCMNTAPATAALSEIAQETIRLFSSPERLDIQRCGAPTCVLLFLKDHPRREWCSTTCGNRVRAARHYQRSKQQRS